MALTPASSDAFMREVDEGLRRDQLTGFGRRYGRWVLAAVAVGLILFGGWLYWQHHRAQVAGEEGERLSAALDKLTRNQLDAARPELTKLSASGNEGNSAAARLALAAVAQQTDLKKAAAEFGAIASDARLARPFRDVALIRQTAIEFDTLAPDLAITRLKPLVVPGNPWFGSAGELTAIAHLKAGRPREAAALFARIGEDEGVPSSLRSRAVQMAGILGTETADQPQASSAR